MEIEFEVPTNQEAKMMACYQQKIHAIDALLAELQTRRANAEAMFRDQENALTRKRNQVIIELRTIREATVTE